MKIISCPIYKSIASALSKDVTEVKVKIFSSSEIEIDIPQNANVDGNDVYLLYSFAESANNQLMEFILAVNALQKMGARKICGIIPYMPYSRQDKEKSGISHGIEVIASLLTGCGIDGLITVDIHSKESLKLFGIKVTNIDITPLLKNIENKTIIFPDSGSKKRYDLEGISMVKTRGKNGMEFQLTDDVWGKDCLIVDDIIDSGKTIEFASQKLIESGAKSVSAYATHGIFSRKNHNYLKNLQKLIVTNSIASLSNIKTKTIDISSLIREKL
ncbi:MAG: ribose-phosphate pyrophosphokinase [Rickettsiaceae bacterium]|nr:ribose-phosphate pyrophosphokinase [Rickettsiaceae bacterium]